MLKEFIEFKNILDKVYPNPPRDAPDKAFKMLKDTDSELLLYRIEDKLIGGCIIIKLSESIYMIEFVAILPEYQNKGYGKKLMEEVHKRKGLFLLESRNKKGFYKKLGYKEMEGNWMFKHE